MTRILCLMCRFASPQYARIADSLVMYRHCIQGRGDLREAVSE